MPAPREFVALYEREYPRLVGVVGLMVSDRALAEDLAQEALIRAGRDWKKVQRLDHPSAWLHRVAVNLATSSHRRRRAEHRMLQRVAAPNHDLAPDPDTAAVESVRRALHQLPVELRAVVVLRFYADFSVADTAAVLHIPEGTVKTRTRRAIAALRDQGLVDVAEVIDAP